MEHGSKIWTLNVVKLEDHWGGEGGESWRVLRGVERERVNSVSKKDHKRDHAPTTKMRGRNFTGKSSGGSGGGIGVRPFIVELKEGAIRILALVLKEMKKLFLGDCL